MLRKSLVFLLVLCMATTFCLVGCANNQEPVATNNEEAKAEETEEAEETQEVAAPEEKIDESNRTALERGNILTVATESLDGKFNSIMCDNVYDDWVVDMIFRGLVTNDPSGEYIPEIATWEISEDKLTYTFNLRKGVKFQDGNELKATDVEFTYYTIANPDYTGPRGYALAGIVGAKDFTDGKAETIEGIKVIDDYTISFTIDEPNVIKIQDFSYGILEKSYYEFANWEDFLSLNQNPMGCGPFKFKFYSVGQYIEVERFDDFYDGTPKLEGVIIKLVPAETKPAELKTGNIDVCNPAANKRNVTMMTETGIADIQEFVGNGYNYIGFNLRLDKLKDKRVRQALAYGLDRKSFIYAQWDGYAVTCNCPISPVSWAFTEDINTYEYNPEKAKELLKEAGWEDRDGDGWVENEKGEKFHIVWTAYNDVEWPMNLIAVAKENWKEIGIDLEAELMEFNAVADKVYEKQDFELYNMGWSLSIDPDPTGIFDGASDVLGGYNSIGYHNDEADQLFKDALKEYDQARRAKMYKTWAQIANDELPYLFIAVREEVWGVNNRVKNLEMGPYFDWVADIENVELDYIK